MDGAAWEALLAGLNQFRDDALQQRDEARRQLGVVQAEKEQLQLQLDVLRQQQATQVANLQAEIAGLHTRLEQANAAARSWEEQLHGADRQLAEQRTAAEQAAGSSRQEVQLLRERVRQLEVQCDQQTQQLSELPDLQQQVKKQVQELQQKQQQQQAAEQRHQQEVRELQEARDAAVQRGDNYKQRLRVVSRSYEDVKNSLRRAVVQNRELLQQKEQWLRHAGGGAGAPEHGGDGQQAAGRAVAAAVGHAGSDDEGDDGVSASEQLFLSEPAGLLHRASSTPSGQLHQYQPEQQQHVQHQEPDGQQQQQHHAQQAHHHGQAQQQQQQHHAQQAQHRGQAQQQQQREQQQEQQQHGDPPVPPVQLGRRRISTAASEVAAPPAHANEQRWQGSPAAPPAVAEPPMAEAWPVPDAPLPEQPTTSGGEAADGTDADDDVDVTQAVPPPAVPVVCTQLAPPPPLQRPQQWQHQRYEQQQQQQQQWAEAAAWPQAQADDGLAGAPEGRPGKRPAAGNAEADGAAADGGDAHPMAPPPPRKRQQLAAGSSHRLPLAAAQQQHLHGPSREPAPVPRQAVEPAAREAAEGAEVLDDDGSSPERQAEEQQQWRRRRLQQAQAPQPVPHEWSPLAEELEADARGAAGASGAAGRRRAAPPGAVFWQDEQDEGQTAAPAVAAASGKGQPGAVFWSDDQDTAQQAAAAAGWPTARVSGQQQQQRRAQQQQQEQQNGGGWKRAVRDHDRVQAAFDCLPDDLQQLRGSGRQQTGAGMYGSGRDSRLAGQQQWLQGPAARPGSAGNSRSSAPAAPAAAGGGGGAGYKYQAVVRKKDEREKLQAVECEQCRRFYEALETWGTIGPQQAPTCGHVQQGGAGALAGGGGGVSRQQLRQEGSRHRYVYEPPATPAEFWNMDLTQGSPAKRRTQGQQQQQGQQGDADENQWQQREEERRLLPGRL